MLALMSHLFTEEKGGFGPSYNIEKWMQGGIIEANSHLQSLSIKFFCLIPLQCLWWDWISMWVLLFSWSHAMIWAPAPPSTVLFSFSGIVQLLYLLHHPTLNNHILCFLSSLSILVYSFFISLSILVLIVNRA